jgi:hypothetical protein
MLMLGTEKKQQKKKTSQLIPKFPSSEQIRGNINRP